MTQNVEIFIFSEDIEPKKRVIRTDFQLFAVVLIAVFGIILLGNFLNNRFHVPRAPVQLTMYVIVAAIAVWLYRFRLTDFRYLLTERMFITDKVIGKKSRPDFQVHLSDIEKIIPFQDLNMSGLKAHGAFHGKKHDTLALVCKVNNKESVLLISPTEEMRTKLIQQWKQVKH